MTEKLELFEKPESKNVVLVGLGNIGSNTAVQMARMGCVRRMTLIDPDRFESKNLQSQAIDDNDIGRFKVEAVADRLERINKDLIVETICTRVEALPQGALRSDAILAGLDSRVSRKYVNEVAWRLGVPWIDAGVDAINLLARVNVYVPAPDAPCLECAWDKNDYAALEQIYPCGAVGDAVPATNAPASLGAVTGGVVAVEAQKLLSGQREYLLDGRQVMFDLKTHNYYVTRFRQHAQCRFDHETWEIETLPEGPDNVTLEQAVVRGGSEDLSGSAIRVEGQKFALMQFCPSCGKHATGPVYLASRIPPGQRVCADCGKPLVIRGFDMTEWLEGLNIAEQDRRRTLSSLGLRPGDLVSVRGPGGTRHFQIDGTCQHDSRENKDLQAKEDRHERLGI